MNESIMAAKIVYFTTVIKLCNLQQLQNRRFHVPQPTFLFPLETPLRLSRNMLHERKDNAVLVKPLAACTHLQHVPICNSVPVIRTASAKKHRRFHVQQPTF